MSGMQIGVSVWPQYTTWDTMRELGRRIEQLGYDSLWTWDHFMPIIGDPKGPTLECWQVLSAWGALTARIRIGALVSGITYRHPAVLANMVSTLDHITRGRAVLGIGAGWFQLEHDQYGIAFDTAGTRLAKLAEAAEIMRSLLDSETTTFAGQHYQLKEARLEPKPVQKRLPIMIGGGGEKKTLRITARFADQWNGFGTPSEIAHKLDVLRQHCQEVGRDISDIKPTVVLSVIVRDSTDAIEEQKREVLIANHTGEPSRVSQCHGTSEQVAQLMAEYYKVGIRGILMGQPAPYDRETLERVSQEVRPRLKQLLSQEAAVS